MRSRNVTIWVMLGVLLLGCPRLLGTVHFKDGLTRDIDYTINDHVWVDYQTPEMQTTVNLLDGGSIRYPYELRVFEDSRLNILGGSIHYQLHAHGSSQVTMSGGLIGSDLGAHNNSQVTISGGLINSHLHLSDNSQVIISGGSVGGELAAKDSSILTIHGSDFAVDGQPFGNGELTSILGKHDHYEPYRHLTGILANGDLLDNDFRIGNNAKIVLTPEPATILLLGLGAVMLRRRHS